MAGTDFRHMTSSDTRPFSSFRETRLSLESALSRRGPLRGEKQKGFPKTFAVAKEVPHHVA